MPEVLALAGSPDALGLNPLAPLCVGSPDKSQKSQLPKVPAFRAGVLALAVLTMFDCALNSVL